MATTIVFDLITRLVDVCAASVPDDVAVYDGQGETGEAGDFLMVGVGDPTSDQGADSANGQQEWYGLGAKAALEQGTVSCCAVAWSGDAGSSAQRATRERVRDIVAAVDLAIKADPNLGGVVAGLEWVRYGQNYQLTQLAAVDGTAAIFDFEIAYRARLV